LLNRRGGAKSKKEEDPQINLGAKHKTSSQVFEGDFHPVLLGLCSIFSQNDKYFAQNGVANSKRICYNHKLARAEV
jgi:hypothetical protein